MSDFGAAVIPIDLVNAAMKRPEPNGWFGGARIASERVLVVTSLHTEEGDVLSRYSKRLGSHSAFQTGVGELAPEILRWFRVEKGFGDRFHDWTVAKKTDTESAIGIELTAALETICTIEPTEKAQKVRCYSLYTNEDETFFGPLTTTVLYRPNPYTKLPKESVARLEGKKVMVVGLGSGGSEIATHLACAGVGTIVAIDDDRLEPANYLRHLLDRRDLGRYKVEAMGDALVERDLPTQVLRHALNVVIDANKFRDLISQAQPDLIICATDSGKSRRVVNHSAVRLGIPLVIAGILGEGRLAEVLIVEPHRTACYECVRTELRAALEAPPSDERPETPYDGGEAENLQSAINRFDVGFAASLATRASIQILDPETYESLPAAYLVWAREKTDYGSPFNFNVPLSLNYVPIAKRDDCPVCGLSQTELSGVDLDERVSQILAEIDSLPDKGIADD